MAFLADSDCRGKRFQRKFRIGTDLPEEIHPCADLFSGFKFAAGDFSGGGTVTVQCPRPGKHHEGAARNLHASGTTAGQIGKFRAVEIADFLQIELPGRFPSGESGVGGRRLRIRRKEQGESRFAAEDHRCRRLSIKASARTVLSIRKNT